MISKFGQFALIGATLFSFMQSVLPLWGNTTNNAYFKAFARPAALGQFVFVFFAYILLTVAFLQNDFSIAYVAANSHVDLPLMYKITAVWGAHEGSILFWVFILNCWTLAFLMIEPRYHDLTIVVAILGLISFSFLTFVVLTSNPFWLAEGSPSGNDLNPLLQDPGFVSHPPMLYTGYVGFSVAFAVTVAALIRNKLDQGWARISRFFALAAWCFLTLGITLGSWWAYRVLGWGGFWFWDPVENASLLPWLSGTALIHVLLLAEKRQTAKAWATVLAIVTFALSVLGTFLVRSGILISAHTFATDPARGVFLLIMLAILCFAALALFIVRYMQMPPQKLNFTLSSREMGLLLNSILLFVAMSTVLLGTLYPLLMDALHLGNISVGAPYFNKVMTPLACVAMFFMAIVPFCHWQEQSIVLLCKKTWQRFLISFAMAAFLLWQLDYSFDFLGLVSLALSIWVILSALKFWRLFRAMSIAHIGFAILIIGVMLSSVLNEEREVRIKRGDQVDLGPYQFIFQSLERADGANYLGIRSSFLVLKRDHLVATLYPEKRRYHVRDMVMSKVDIHPGLFRDLYIALGEPLNQGYWSVRLYYKPFIRWIWFGGLIMLVGGGLAIYQKRRSSLDLTVKNYRLEQSL